jgi:hypothetical protein
MDIGTHPYIVGCAAITMGYRFMSVGYIKFWSFSTLAFGSCPWFLNALPPLKALTKQKSSGVI